jgi:2-iminobutanoate/2-iminopropanoate deaminase
MSIECFDPPQMCFPGMSQAVRAGGWVHVAGQVSVRDGIVVGPADALAQSEQCFANIRAALQAAGADLDQVVKLGCFLVDRHAYGAYAQVRNRLFATNPPASTVLIVSGLLMPELLLEVEALAWAP